MDNKRDLRIKAKAVRNNLQIDDISHKATKLIQKCELYISSKHVMIYYPKEGEINLLELLNDNKSFYLPRVNGKYLDICPYKMGNELKKSKYNVLEPINQAVNCENIDLVIVPSLMADSFNFRLGYGGGYYDRFLCNSFKTLSVIPKELFVKKLPTDKYDKKIDQIIVI